MRYIPPYNPDDFKSPFDGLEYPGAYLRFAVITGVNPEKGTVEIEWLDHPAGRQEVLMSTAGQGFFELPTIGSTVIVGMDKGYAPHILRFLPIGYRDMVGTPRAGVNVVPTLRKILPGEKMLVSYVKDILEEGADEINIPILTGTYVHMSHMGDIHMTTANGDYWTLSREENTIVQSSMNAQIMTEAGILDFGLIKRIRNYEDGAQIILKDGTFLGDTPTISNIDALNEFHLCILESADAVQGTSSVDNPFIELVLGTKIKKETISTTASKYSTEKTDDTHAVPNKEIMIQLKTKADQGFEFTVDKEGNLTVKVKGNVKYFIEGDAQVNIAGNSVIDVTQAATISADKITLRADNAGDIKIAGNGAEQPIVLKKFITAQFNKHKHFGNSGSPTSAPIIPAPCSPGNDVSKITHAG